ncbi:MAG: hypothetical protein P8N49_09665 [Opitutales bacterium]|nr:hypothetical protein [Opitutales bacterium]
MSLNTINEVEGEGEGARPGYPQTQRPGYVSHSTPVQKMHKDPSLEKKGLGDKEIYTGSLFPST